MRVALATCWNAEFVPIAKTTVPIMRAYAEKHGYTFHPGVYKTDPANLRDYGDRGKLDLFCQLYDAFDIVCFMDCDTVVMNGALRIDEVIGNRERPFLWTHDPNGPCSGFWIARCTPLVRHTLTTVQRLAQERGAVRITENLGPPHSVSLQMEPRGTSDQMTMRGIMHDPPFNAVLGNCVPLKAAGHCYDDFSRYGWDGLEALGQYEPGDWLVTAPALPIAQKADILSRFAEQAR